MSIDDFTDLTDLPDFPDFPNASGFPDEAPESLKVYAAARATDYDDTARAARDTAVRWITHSSHMADRLNSTTRRTITSVLPSVRTLAEQLLASVLLYQGTQSDYRSFTLPTRGRVLGELVQIFADLDDPASTTAHGNVSPSTTLYRFIDTVETFEEVSGAQGWRQPIDSYCNLAPRERIVVAAYLYAVVDPRSVVDSPHESSAPSLDALGTSSQAAPSPNLRITEAPKFAESVDDLVAELDRLPGLAEVKSVVRGHVALAQANQARSAHGLKRPESSHHLVFTGNPGTGKTTVARLIARLYRAIGVVSRGQLVETDRAGLIGQWLGTSALLTTAALDVAEGGVLFIDEAYSLAGTVDRGPDGFAQEALDTLVKGMEDRRSNLIVVLAGYTHEMDRLLDMNPGLRSRMGGVIPFADYSDDELCDILALITSNDDITLPANWQQVLTSHTLKARTKFGMHFGNARAVRNLYAETLAAQARRLQLTQQFDSESLREFTHDDLSVAVARLSGVSTAAHPPSASFGFTHQHTGPPTVA